MADRAGEKDINVKKNLAQLPVDCRPPPLVNAWSPPRGQPGPTAPSTQGEAARRRGRWRRAAGGGLNPFLAPWLSRTVFVTKCPIVTLASFIVVGMWTIPASSQLNEANVPRSCFAFPRFCELITQEAGRTGLDPRLVDAVIKVESGYRPDAIGAGAK